MLKTIKTPKKILSSIFLWLSVTRDMSGFVTNELYINNSTYHYQATIRYVREAKTTGTSTGLMTIPSASAWGSLGNAYWMIGYPVSAEEPKDETIISAPVLWQ